MWIVLLPTGFLFCLNCIRAGLFFFSFWRGVGKRWGPLVEQCKKTHPLPCFQEKLHDMHLQNRMNWFMFYQLRLADLTILRTEIWRYIVPNLLSSFVKYQNTFCGWYVGNICFLSNIHRPHWIPQWGTAKVTDYPSSKELHLSFWGIKTHWCRWWSTQNSTSAS